MKETTLKRLLESYSIYKNFVRSQQYAVTYFNTDGTRKVDKKEEYEEKMNAIESLIQLIEPSNEYTLLHLHYIHGIPIEKCAESMLLSRTTAYRMLNKAYRSICELVNEKGK